MRQSSTMLLIVFLLLSFNLCSQNTVTIINVDTTLFQLHDSLVAADEVTIGRIYNKLSSHHFENDLDSSKYYAEKALSINIQQQEQLATAESYWYLGGYSLHNNQYKNTEYYLKKGLELCYQLRDTTRILKFKNRIGLALNNLGRIDEAAEVFRSAIETAQYVNDIENQINLFINLGVLNKRNGNLETAFEYYNSAKQLADTRKDTSSIIPILINISNIYNEKEEYDSAYYYLENAEELALITGNTDRLATIYTNFGGLEINSDRYESAILYLNKVFPLHSAQSEAKILGYLNMSEAYFKLKEYDIAKEYLQIAEQTAKATNGILFLKDIYLSQSNWYEEIGDHEQALQYLKKYIIYKDSIFSKEKLHETSRIESRYALRDKEAKINELEQSSEQQEQRYKNLKFWLFFVLLSLVSSFSIFYIYSLQQRAKQASISQQAAENKLEALRNQMNPHFLFNSLNAIQHFVLKSEKFKAYNYLAKFAHLLRKVLDNTPNMTIDVQEELKILRSYVELEALRFQDKFEYQFEVTDEVESMNITIPSMMIQPYIENAILHGLSNKEAANGKLRIQIYKQEDNYLHCIIQDNGIGREKAQAIKAQKSKYESKKSIAMNNIAKRMQIMEKAGYEWGQVVVEDLYLQNNTATGTRVIIKLPIVKMSET